MQCASFIILSAIKNFYFQKLNSLNSAKSSLWVHIFYINFTKVALLACHFPLQTLNSIRNLKLRHEMQTFCNLADGRTIQLHRILFWITSSIYSLEYFEKSITFEWLNSVCVKFSFSRDNASTLVVLKYHEIQRFTSVTFISASIMLSRNI